MLERLVVRAELSAFERSLRDRLERIAAMDDERIAKPRSIERGHDGALIVLSEFVPGSRLSELLDATAQQGTVPGLDVALGYLLDVLPALCGLHAGAGFAHGAITPGRTVLTPAGQVVLLDGIFGEALSRLQYNRQHLWNEFGIAIGPASGPPRFDASCDISQTALCAVMLMIGRPIAEYEYPDVIPSMLVEVVDVAQIRGTSDFATGLQHFLQRALPLPGRRPYTAADDALIDVRDLARELGLDVCRRALLEFIEQQESGGSTAILSSDSDATGLSDEYGAEEFEARSNGDGDAPDSDEDGTELELDLDGDAAPEEDTVYDLSSTDESAEPTTIDEPVEAPVEEPFPATAIHADAFVPPEPEPQPDPVTPPADTLEAAPFVDEPIGQAPAIEESLEPVAEAAPVEEPAAEPAFEPASSIDEEPEPVAASEAEPAFDESSLEAEDASSLDADEAAEETPSLESVTDAEPAEEDAKSSRRRKRSRSARSRKDKLRSAARPQPLIPAPTRSHLPMPPPAAPPPAPAAKTRNSGWLVEPARAATFEPPVPAQPAVAPPVVAPPPLAPPIVAAPPPVAPPIALAPPPPPPAPVLQPPVAPLPMPRPISAPAPPPPPPIPIRPAAPIAPAPALKLKTEAPAGYAPPRKARPDPVEDIYSSRAVPDAPQQASEFPWKLAAAAVAFIALAIVGGKWYMSSSKAAPPPVAAEAAPPVTEQVSAAAPKMGRVQIETQPAGARVLFAGKHLGDAPLTIELPVGRHTLTFATSSDSVRRTVRVEAGKTLALSVPIYRGWLDVVAPIILEVSENGKPIGDTEQSQLLLPPGRHELTFTNRDLDYTSTHVVEIEPGLGKRLTINPTGLANLNASPWAEVWMNGKKLGDTPLANIQLPLGTHEIVFKNPDFGERRMTTTIRANAPVALSVDLRKP